MEAFEPPEAGNAPAGVKAILKRVYNGCRAAWVKDHPGDRENAENKTACSQTAWAAVKQAGWKQVDGAWRKEHVNMEDFFVTMGDVARVKLEGRKGRQRELADEVLAAYRRKLVSTEEGKRKKKTGDKEKEKDTDKEEKPLQDE